MKRERFLTSSQVSDWLTPTIRVPSRPLGGIAYQAAVIADTPLRYWRFEELSGAYVTTYGPSTATVMSSPTRAAGGAAGSQRAVGFPTVSDYVQLDAAGNLPDTGYRSSFSWECWLKVSALTDVPTGQGTYQLVGTDSEVDGFILRSWATLMVRTTASIGKVLVGVASGSSQIRVQSTGRLDDGLWHHVVGTYDAVNLKIYVDGAAQGSVAFSGAVNPGQYPAVIGLNYPFGGSYPATAFPGLVDEVAIYPTALSAARVLAHYLAGA